MNLSIDDSVLKKLPEDVVSLIQKEYSDDKYIPRCITAMHEFYTWCKKDCKIDHLCHTILRNDGILLSQRVRIVSYLLSDKWCKKDRMTADERKSIEAIRAEQVSMKKDVLKKRRLEEVSAGKDARADDHKRLKLSSDAEKEVCVSMKGIPFPSDALVHCLSYMDMEGAHRVRDVCKAFYRAYTLNTYQTYIHVLSNTHIISAMKKIALHASHRGASLHLQHMRIYSLRINRYQREGNNAGFYEALRGIATVYRKMCKEYNVPPPIGRYVLYIDSKGEIQHNDYLFHHTHIIRDPTSMVLYAKGYDVSNRRYLGVLSWMITKAHTLYYVGTVEQMEHILANASPGQVSCIVKLVSSVDLTRLNLLTLFPNLKYLTYDPRLYTI